MWIPHPGVQALYELFDLCVTNGEEKLTQVKQMYLDKLDLKTIQLIDDILNDEFYVSRYRNLAQHEDLFYQGLWDETGEIPPTADPKWLALRELVRRMSSGADAAPGADDAPADGEPSGWLYLGTYYFGYSNPDYAAYQTFIGKVAAFVKHVGNIINQRNLIDTF